METITIKLRKTRKGWTWYRRSNVDKIHGNSFHTYYKTASDALYGAYAWELRGDEDKPNIKGV